MVKNRHHYNNKSHFGHVYINYSNKSIGRIEMQAFTIINPSAFHLHPFKIHVCLHPDEYLNTTSFGVWIVIKLEREIGVNRMYLINLNK